MLDETGTTATRTERAFILDILEGVIPGHSVVTRFGFNTAVPSTFVDITSLGGVRILPLAANPVIIESSDAGDGPVGVGARTVRVTGLDAEHKVIFEDLLTVSGAPSLPTTQNFLRLIDMRVLTTGLGIEGFNIGNIVGSINAVNQMQITEGFNVSKDVGYTVPAEHVLYLQQITFGVGAGREVELRFRQRPEGGLWYTEGQGYIFETVLGKETNYAFGFKEKTDINIQGKLGSVGTAPEVSCDYVGVLVHYEDGMPPGFQ